MTQIWPFPPLSGLVESLEWATDLFMAKAGEQRIALRTEPRRSFLIAHLLNDYEYSSARAMIREADEFLVPDWGQAINIGAVSPGSNVSLGADPDFTDIGDTALIWESPELFEQVDVSLASFDILAATVTNAYTDARLIPLWLADAPQGLSNSRSPAQINQCSITFNINENTDLAFSDYPQYRNHDVMTSCPVIGSGSFDESVLWISTSIDAITNTPYYVRRFDTPNEIYTMRWHEFTRQGIYELRQWLHSRRGKQKVFWHSSRGKDFEPANDISGTTVKVFALPGLIGVGRSVAFDIDITSTSGVSYYRRVSGISVGIPVNGRDTLNLSINSAVSLSQAQIKRISLLRCVRFNSDRIELQHNAGGGVEVKVPVIEVPEP